MKICKSIVLGGGGAGGGYSFYQYLIVLLIGRSSGVIYFEVRAPSSNKVCSIDQYQLGKYLRKQVFSEDSLRT